MILVFEKNAFVIHQLIQLEPNQNVSSVNTQIMNVEGTKFDRIVQTIQIGSKLLI